MIIMENEYVVAFGLVIAGIILLNLIYTYILAQEVKKSDIEGVKTSLHDEVVEVTDTVNSKFNVVSAAMEIKFEEVKTYVQTLFETIEPLMMELPAMFIGPTQDDKGNIGPSVLATGAEEAIKNILNEEDTQKFLASFVAPFIKQSMEQVLPQLFQSMGMKPPTPAELAEDKTKAEAALGGLTVAAIKEKINPLMTMFLDRVYPDWEKEWQENPRRAMMLLSMAKQYGILDMVEGLGDKVGSAAGGNPLQAFLPGGTAPQAAKTTSARKTPGSRWG